MSQESVTMICRGGSVVDVPSPSDAARDDRSAPFLNDFVVGPVDSADASSPSRIRLPSDAARAGQTQRRTWQAAIVFAFLVAALGALAWWTNVAPLVESDYAYQLIAADHALHGLGFTAPPPVAPRQPWTYQSDFAFLTRWPVGYSALLAGISSVTGGSVLASTRILSVLVCAAAALGWFFWIRRLVPRGFAAFAVSVVTSTAAMQTSFLFHPSTDAVVVAAVPWILLLVHRAWRTHSGTFFLCALAGFMSGSLFWIRYAAIFVPLGIVFAWIIPAQSRWPRLRGLLAYSICAAAPVLGLLSLNQSLGLDRSVHQSLNLGRSMGFDLSFGAVAHACWNVTAVAALERHPIARGMILLGFLGVIVASVVAHFARRSRPKALSAHEVDCPKESVQVADSDLRRYLKSSPLRLSLAMTLSLLAMLICASTLFAEKYDFARLPRYFAPVVPLVIAVVLAVLVHAKIPLARIVAVALAAALGVQTAARYWPNEVRGMRAASETQTEMGRRSVCFEPDAQRLFDWIKSESDESWILFSNFHDYITLETKRPALPLPASREEMNSWVSKVCQVRGIPSPSIRIVLDPNHRWRAKHLPPMAEIVERLDLAALAPWKTFPGAIVYSP